MTMEIIAAINSLKQLGELLAAAKGLSNYNELVSAVSEVNSKLMAATTIALSSQEKQMALTNRVAELEAALAKFENWEKKIKRYALFKFPTGHFAYALKPNIEQSEPSHYLCANCVDKKQVSYLQPSSSQNTLWCQVCKSSFEISHSTLSSRGHR